MLQKTAMFSPFCFTKNVERLIGSYKLAAVIDLPHYRR
jgi:hypothetical protein